MRGFIIFILMLLGFGLMFRTILDFQKQKRYSFKNTALLKKQQMSLLIGVIGAIIFVVSLWALVF